MNDKPYELHIEATYYKDDMNYYIGKTLLKFLSIKELSNFCDKAGVNFR